MAAFDIYLIRPTRYDDEGYPVQWWRSIVPSNSLAAVTTLMQDVIDRGVLGDADVKIHVIDEVHSFISPKTIIRDVQKRGSRCLVGLVGVQSNQFPRAVDLSRDFLAAGIPVCIGGFHVSGCLSMLKTLPPDLIEARELGISFFAGEGEDQRFDEVLLDAYEGRLKPLYDHSKVTPNIAGAPVPILHPDQVAKNINRYSSFDLGRGCPFECSFCTIINVQGRKSRFRTPDDLELIIRENAKLGIDRFFLTDDNFARNKEWEKFTDRLIALRAEGLKIRMVIQVDTLAHKIKNFIPKVVEAGADQIFIGMENLNSDNLEFVKKRQNRIETYKEMFLAWKQYPVVITCGYIIGFPNDTKERILNDIEILKRELPIDTLYMNFLTPLPGSEDHQKLYEAGVWMDPDMTKYDLNHRVTHHPKMTDQEWEEAYREAHASFFTWEHMETVLKRMVALRSNKKLATVNRLLAYREAIRLENCAMLEAGYIRVKRRKARRHGLPIENPITFYAKYARHLVRSTTGLFATYIRLRLVLRRVLKDPKRFEYTDAAIRMPDATSGDVLLQHDRATVTSQKRRAKVAGSATEPAPAALPVAASQSATVKAPAVVEAA